MVHMRPGTKVRFWSPRFDNRPDVEPPGLLKFAGVLAMISFAGAIFFAVYLTLEMGGQSIPGGFTAIAFAVVHFILPFGVFYLISVNSPLSRFTILAYMLALAALTFTGGSLLSNVVMATSISFAVFFGVWLIVFLWLFYSPKMRFYYAAIRNKPTPPDLVGREEELQGGRWLSVRSRQRIEWIVDHVEEGMFIGIAILIFVLLFTESW